MDERKSFGNWGEDMAAKKLSKEDYMILHRNFHCRLGEVDIIAWDEEHGELVFVEVKSRKELAYGLPCEAVNVKKQEHIKRCAEVYMSLFKIKGIKYRMDVIEVLYLGGNAYIRHLINCFE